MGRGSERGEGEGGRRGREGGRGTERQLRDSTDIGGGGREGRLEAGGKGGVEF